MPVPTRGRASVKADGEGLEIVIPARRSLFVSAFVGVWLLGWTLGELVMAVIVLAQLAAGNWPGFGLLWLAGWTLAGAVVWTVWLWMTVGREVVAVDGTALTHRRDVLGWGRTRAYRWSDVRDLRATAPTPGASWFGWGTAWPSAGGSIAFDHGMATRRMGQGLDEAEARHLVSLIRQRFPLGDDADAGGEPAAGL